MDTLLIILALPIKLIAKAAAHILASVIGVCGGIIMITSVILEKLGSIVGGIAFPVAILMLVTTGDTQAFTLMGLGAALILVPLVICAVSSGLIMIKNLILEWSADIDLI